MLFLFFLIVPLIATCAAISSDTRDAEMLLRGKRQTEATSYFYYQQPEYPRDCKEVYDECEGQSADGVFLIKPEGSREPFEVYCNNSIDGGSWTVFQRRVDGSVDFYRDWSDYKRGFGFLRGDFWLGNDKIAYLTNQKSYELRIDLNNVNGELFFAKYDLFRISDEGSKYRLVGLGEYNSVSTANSDALAASRNLSFSTRDQDNDLVLDQHCATKTNGAWWYGSRPYFLCGDSVLNSIYNAVGSDLKDIRWIGLPGSGNGRKLKYTEMKLRPKP